MPRPTKVEAIQMMPTPKSPLEVCRFSGMANQLGKFLPSLAEMSKSLWDLFSKNTRSWGESQAKAFQAVKKALSSSPILVFTSQTVRPSFQQMLCLLVLVVLATGWIMETHCLCFTCPHNHQITICTNREGGIGPCLVL